MARAYPAFQAGEGDTLGVRGNESEWPYVVELDNEGDDPIAVMLTTIRLGDPHPDPRFAPLMLVGDYRKGERINEKTWFVWVLFKNLSEATIGLWRRGGRFANETRRIYRSLQNRAADGTVLDPAIPIGPSKWVKPTPPVAGSEGLPPDPGDPWTNQYYTLDDKRNQQPLNLAQKIDPSNFGRDINDGILSLTYEITIPQLNITQITGLTAQRWRTNHDRWPTTGARRYPRWSLIFSNFAFDDEALVIGNQPRWYSHLIMEFLYRPITVLTPQGWRGEIEIQYYSDDEGYIGEVYDANRQGALVTKNYVLYEQTDYNWLFSITGASPPVI